MLSTRDATSPRSVFGSARSCPTSFIETIRGDSVRKFLIKWTYDPVTHEPIDGLSTFLSAAYTDASYISYPNAPCPIEDCDVLVNGVHVFNPSASKNLSGAALPAGDEPLLCPHRPKAGTFGAPLADRADGRTHRQVRIVRIRRQEHGAQIFEGELK